MRLFSFYLTAIFLSVACSAQSNEAISFKYHLKILKNEIRLVDVRASMVVKDSYLQMGTGGIPRNIKGGWASFVEIKSITDKEGNDINYQWDNSKNHWQLNSKKNSEIKLHYQVMLRHDQFDWNTVGGVDGRPTVFQNETVLWITKGLFVYPVGETSKKSEVTFDVPENWNISTAWIKTGPRKFMIKNLEALSNNLLMLGKHEERIITYDDMTITIAVTPEFKARAQVLEQTLTKVLPIYKKVFDELPYANYLICASQNFFEDGEAYYNSFHQMFVNKDLEHRKIVWANILAHEMFHYWNGTNFIVGSDVSGNSWFSEGFTEYYSNLALIRSRIVSQEEYLDKLAFQFARFYSSQAFTRGKQPNLIEAGKEKSKHWHLIYGGGASIAFMLDVEIRNLTENEKSLDNFMRALYIKYGKSKKSITLKNQIQELNLLTGTDFGPFFDKYVTGTEFNLIPILQACNKAGIIVAQYQGEFFLKPRSTSSIFKSIIDQQ
jgi:predicted metalloprotease with PDZ domain